MHDKHYAQRVGVATSLAAARVSAARVQAVHQPTLLPSHALSPVHVRKPCGRRYG